ncbi:MAG: hypothetical protein UHD05_06090 [Ruminococcus sp.]|nr:hypothetical protein [Ruminococcus sp.]
MNSMIKKYVPYTVAIFAIFLLAPVIFKNGPMATLVPVVWYFIFPGTAIVTSALYCSKYGLDFLLALIAPIAYIPTMLIYYGGFNFANLILLAVYLASGIFGLFVGDIALGDKRKQREQKEQAKAEELMLEMKRRDELVKEQVASHKETSDDDFDYDKYLSDIDKTSSQSVESEIDDILNEFGSH